MKISTYDGSRKIRIPQSIDRIILCGALSIEINDDKESYNYCPKCRQILLWKGKKKDERNIRSDSGKIGGSYRNKD